MNDSIILNPGFAFEDTEDGNIFWFVGMTVPLTKQNPFRYILQSELQDEPIVVSSKTTMERRYVRRPDLDKDMHGARNYLSIRPHDTIGEGRF